MSSMNNLDRIQLSKMIDANNVQDYTADIRAKKHSEKIKADVERLVHLKRKYARLSKEQLDTMCVSQCNFIFNNYTDIFNKVKKGEMNLEILAQLLTVLKQIEDGLLDQHAGAFEVGKLMQRIYIDSALMKQPPTTSSNEQQPIVAPKNISWKEYKTSLTK